MKNVRTRLFDPGSVASGAVEWALMPIKGRLQATHDLTMRFDIADQILCDVIGRI